MNTYVALFRGINVGAKNRIKMELLRDTFTSLHLSNVRTYLQSGNVLFDSSITDTAQLATIIRTAVAPTGVDVPVLVISQSSILQIINQNPFYKPEMDFNTLHITLLYDNPNPALCDKIKESSIGNDTFSIDRNVIYIKCTGNYSDSKLTNNFFESKLKVTATTRNLKTMMELGRM
jgi:uncharacterized protein (DUF1697 family)